MSTPISNSLLTLRVAETTAACLTAATDTPARQKNWQTVTVSVNPYTWRRRTILLLGGASVAAVSSGCALTEPEKAHSLDTRGLKEVLNSSRELATSYNAAIKALPDLSSTFEVLHDNHVAHAETLERILGTKPATDTDLIKGSDSAEAVDVLVKAEHAAASQAIDACVNAVERFAVVLGEIAAGRTSHVDALEVL